MASWARRQLIVLGVNDNYSDHEYIKLVRDPKTRDGRSISAKLQINELDQYCSILLVKMHFLGWLTVSLSAGLTYAAAHPKLFNNHVIFTPPQGTKVSYPRIVELSDGTILATIAWRDPKAPLPYFPIFQSKDNGWTWKHISNLTDQVNGLGFGSQPALAELPCRSSGPDRKDRPC